MLVCPKKMKSIQGLVLGVLVFVGANGLSINSRASSGGACHPSPCGEGATCELNGGLTVCKCPEGQSGDPFSSCLPGSSSSKKQLGAEGSERPQETSSHPMMVMMTSVPMSSGSGGGVHGQVVPSTHYFVQTTETLANGGGYEVDYSRVPMRGDEAAGMMTQRPGVSSNSNNNGREDSRRIASSSIMSPLREGIAVATTGNVFLSPQVPFQKRRPGHQEESEGGLVLGGGGTRRQPGNSNSFLHLNNQADYVPTEDPLGVFQRCRAVNGIVVCAENSGTNNDLGSLSANFNIPVRHDGDIARPAPPHHHNNNHHQWEESKMNVGGSGGGISSGGSSRVPMISIASSSAVSSSGTSSDLCKTMCGINSVCRLVLERPVCGCPEGTTGDPSVRCEGMEDQMMNNNVNKSGGGNMEMCSRHTECKESEICVRGQCSDPCRSTMDAGGMCGENSKCVVLQHTPLCGCQDGFSGNPYQRCTRIA